MWEDGVRMRRVFSRRCLQVFAVFAGLALVSTQVQPQDSTRPKAKELPDHDGWASLSGSVTFEGEVPQIDEPGGGIPKDTTWLLDSKTKGLASVIVWLSSPMRSQRFPVHPD